MPGLTLPPFPEDLPTHPLIIVDYGLVKSGDSQEIDKLWKASTELGFWYLKNHGAEPEVEGMFDMGEETLALPQEEKMKYLRGDGAFTFGIKQLGSGATNEYGNPDNVEFINVSKEDALAYPEVFHRTYPSAVNARMGSTIIPFVQKSVDIIDTVLSVYEMKLGMPAGTLLKLHPHMEASGSEARCIKSPPKKAGSVGSITKEDVFLGAHTDFGSLSFLHNRLGGLQVFPPGSAEWQYVLPIPGHAICNIGDSLSVFSGGILRSNLHRTVPPPGAQASQTRWSMGYFSRPANRVSLRALDESEAVKDALSRMSSEQRAMYFPNVTQGDWYARRMDNLQLKNRKGPETYRASRGMEHRPDAI
ncbi:hypothetical protein ACEPAF_8443 [Sanghuangporus sanghuang]